MFRLRRYRVFLVFATIAVGLLYHFRSLGDLQNAGSAGVEGLKSLGHKVESSTENLKNPAAGYSVGSVSSPGPSIATASEPATKNELKDERPPKANAKVDPTEDAHKESKEQEPKVASPTLREGKYSVITPAAFTSSVRKAAVSESSLLGNPVAVNRTGARPIDSSAEDEDEEGRLEVSEDNSVPKLHWALQPEHFPVPTSNIIRLPTGKPKMIPKIQYDFTADKLSNKLVDQDKLDVIRKAFTFSWSGYRRKAWRQDELTPVSGKYRNPFCGWGATLVDTLDTLWMMDLKDEFDEALEVIKDMDFTTSSRNDIPLFETVIRYLGGLISAYDISESTHRILLDKAVELADILMGSFDTPNRMPMTYYRWKPAFASQPHRAKTRVVLAELGSLSLEFTRLAQITKEAKYYDAVARITNELSAWQSHTKVPGLWPMKVDASGCKKKNTGSSTSSMASSKDAIDGKIGKPSSDLEKPTTNRTTLDVSSVSRGESASKSDAVSAVNFTAIDETEEPANIKGSEKSPSTADINASARTTHKESSKISPQGGVIRERDTAVEPEPSSQSKEDVVIDEPDCEPQGLASPPYSVTEDFSLGGQADSVYEYLPKEYLLLGGLEPKYQSMYEMAVAASKKHLIFRPMIPDDKRSILQAGLLKSSGKDKAHEKANFKPEGAHLTCFVGGMFAVGAKVFDRKEDMDLAKKLTDGCVWAYEATKTGIMPETYLSIACKDADNCSWNETLWKEELDPYGTQREQDRLRYQSQQVLNKDAKSAAISPKEATESAVEADTASTAFRAGLAKEEKPIVKWKDAKDADEKVIKADATAAADHTALANSQALPEKTTSSSSISFDSKAIENPFQGSKTIEEEPLPHKEAQKPETTGGQPSAEPEKRLLKKRQLGELDKTSSNVASTLSSDETAVTGVPLSTAPSIDKSATNKDPDNKAPSTKLSNKKGSKTVPSDSISEEKDSANNATSESVEGLRTTEGKSGAKGAKLADYEKLHQTTVDQSPVTRVNSTELASQYSPPSIPTREEYVAARIKDERLPIGMTKITGARYLLRPEAIESVFIMYRTTGDEYWREKGWAMFKAIEKHTIATHGASAILDVTSEKPKPADEMESFWLAETLKYFYLLYSDPSHVSLDEWVLNTEAHPFKRPK